MRQEQCCLACGAAALSCNCGNRGTGSTSPKSISDRSGDFLEPPTTTLVTYPQLLSAAAPVQIGHVNKTYEAISIGPDSDIDSCWLFPQSHLPGPPSLSTNITNLKFDPSSAMFLSVDRPWMGRVAGPFAILSKYGNIACNGKFGGLNIQAFGNEASVRPQPTLDLQFWPRIPPSGLPSIRPPKSLAFITTIASPFAFFPCYGRRRMTLEFNIGDSQDVTITAYRAAPVAEFNVGSFAAALLAATTLASGQYGYQFEGDYDYIKLAAANAASYTEAIATFYDV